MTRYLRHASSADLSAIMRIENETFGPDAWSHVTMFTEIDSEHNYYLVAEDPEARIIGYAGLFTPASAGTADVQTVAVTASHQGRGVGRNLMIKLLAEARVRHVEHVFLEVRTNNKPAITLYESLGFIEIDRRLRYYGDGGDAIVMSRQDPGAFYDLAESSTDANDMDDETKL